MKKTVKISILFIALSMCTAYTFARGRTEHSERIPEGKIPIAVTFDAMKELTKIVGQDKVYIHTIIPPGVAAHDFEPKAGNLQFLSKAKAVVYNGLGMEQWLNKAIEAVHKPDLVQICTTQGIEPIQISIHEHGHEDCDGSCGHDHGEYDPHAWLSLNSAKIMVYNICRGLSEIDPAHKDFYEANAHVFIADADIILSHYQQKFAQIAHKNFVTSHAAFSYFCRDLGLHQKSVSDVFAAREPTAQQLAKLTDYCREHHITTIFTERMANHEVAKTLAKEVGAAVEYIYTLETAEDSLSYMNRMEYNLKKIYESFIK